LQLLSLVLLAWILPLTACALIGLAAFVILDSFFARESDFKVRSIGIPVIAAGASLFGLRLMNLFFVLIGKTGISFRATVVFAVILALASAYLIYRFIWHKKPLIREPNLLRSLVWRQDISVVHAVIISFSMALAFAAIAAPLSSWDLFTHWLVVPQEILRQNQMAFVYPTSRTVAPNYPTHQVLLGAVAMLSSGRRDGITNGFANIFLLLGILAVIEATWLVAYSRFLSLGAALFVLAVAGTQPDVFGFFYGDALVIASIAFACLGIVYRIRYRSRSSPSVTWAFITMPLMAKGVGLYAAFFGALILIGIECVTAIRKKTSPWKKASVGLGIFGGIALLEIAIPRLVAWNVTSNFHVPRIGLNILHVAPTDALADLIGFLVKTKVVTLRTLLITSFLAPVVGMIYWRRWLRSSQRWVALVISLYGFSTALILALAILYVPAVKDSLPRYATMVAPIIAILVCSGLGTMKLLGRIIGIPLVAIAVSVLLGSHIPGYITKHTKWSLTALSRMPQKHDEFERTRALYDSIRWNVDPVRGRVFVVLPDNDQFIPYRMGLYFVMTGIRARLISKVSTCTEEEMELANRVQHWVISEKGKTPPPPEIDLNRDYLVFPKPVPMGKQVLKGLLAAGALQRIQ
jgi:hypothetical protein